MIETTKKIETFSTNIPAKTYCQKNKLLIKRPLLKWLKLLKKNLKKKQQMFIRKLIVKRINHSLNNLSLKRIEIAKTIKIVFSQKTFISKDWTCCCTFRRCKHFHHFHSHSLCLTCSEEDGQVDDNGGDDWLCFKKGKCKQILNIFFQWCPLCHLG